MVHAKKALQILKEWIYIILTALFHIRFISLKLHPYFQKLYFFV